MPEIEIFETVSDKINSRSILSCPSPFDSKEYDVINKCMSTTYTLKMPKTLTATGKIDIDLSTCSDFESEYQKLINKILGIIKEGDDTLMPNATKEKPAKKKKVYVEQSKEPYVFSNFIPDQIIFGDPITTILWSDGTRTMVKKAPDKPFDKYDAFCAALAKKVYGTNSTIHRHVNNGIMMKEKKKKTEPVEEA